MHICTSGVALHIQNMRTLSISRNWTVEILLGVTRGSARLTRVSFLWRWYPGAIPRELDQRGALEVLDLSGNPRLRGELKRAGSAVLEPLLVCEIYIEGTVWSSWLVDVVVNAQYVEFCFLWSRSAHGKYLLSNRATNCHIA